MCPISLRGRLSSTTTTLLGVFLGLLLAPTPAMSARNITVDSPDSSILYAPSGSWEQLPGDLDFGRNHMLTGDSTATAVFTFSGTAIYFLAPLWPFPLTTGISLDGDSTTTISLQDPTSVLSPNADGGETVESGIVWSRTGLVDTEHTLVVSVVPNADGSQSFAVVDALIYTSESTLTPSASNTPTTSAVILSTISSQPTGTSSASSGDTHQNKTGLSIALGIVCTVFGLLVLYALRWLWVRRQRRLAEEASAGRVVPEPEMAEATAISGAGAGSEAGSGWDSPASGSGLGSSHSTYSSFRPRSQKELAAAAIAAAVAMEEEEEQERERERERERDRRRRKAAPGPSGLRHSTVVGSADEDQRDQERDGESSSSDTGYDSPRRSRKGSSNGSVRRKRSADSSAILGTIPERRESYTGAGNGGVPSGGGDAVPPWREVDADSRYPRPGLISGSNSNTRTGQRTRGT